ncbi:MAG: DUF1971 domain-containing protein [Alphaproteobacteria bacterium]|nr:DUF1971 domain-containing protein [Alphaproteobacteria bacterium]
MDTTGKRNHEGVTTLPDSLPAHASLHPRHGAPAALLKDHRTKEGVWGVLHVVSGALEFHDYTPDYKQDPTTAQSRVLHAGDTRVIKDSAPHRVKPLGAASFLSNSGGRKIPS